jgi:hypothetical protein
MAGNLSDGFGVWEGREEEELEIGSPHWTISGTFSEDGVAAQLSSRGARRELSETDRNRFGSRPLKAGTLATSCSS